MTEMTLTAASALSSDRPVTIVPGPAHRGVGEPPGLAEEIAYHGFGATERLADLRLLDGGRARVWLWCEGSRLVVRRSVRLPEPDEAGEFRHEDWREADAATGRLADVPYLLVSFKRRSGPGGILAVILTGLVRPAAPLVWDLELQGVLPRGTVRYEWWEDHFEDLDIADPEAVEILHAAAPRSATSCKSSCVPSRSPRGPPEQDRPTLPWSDEANRGVPGEDETTDQGHEGRRGAGLCGPSRVSMQLEGELTPIKASRAWVHDDG